MDMTLKEFAERYWGMFTANFDEDEKIQTFIIEGSSGDVTVMLTPWSSDKEKFAVLTAVIGHMIEVKATRYALYSEAWISTSSADTPREERVMPSEDPDRREIVMCTAVARDGQVHHQSAVIHRDLEGKRILRQVIHNEGGTHTGLMTTLFRAAERLESLSPSIRELILKSSGTALIGIDPQTGKELSSVRYH